MGGKFNRNDTLTGVCNSALAMVGETRFIEDVESEDNDLSVILRMLAEQVCKEVQSHEFAVWDELIEDVELVKRREDSETGGEFEGVREFNLPFQMISPVECYTPEESGVRRRVPYEIYGGYLHCRVGGKVRLRYVRYSFNPAEWGTELRACVIKLLAARILAAIVKNFKDSQTMEQQFWTTDFTMWAVSKRNKAMRGNTAGDDEVLSRFYEGCGE